MVNDLEMVFRHLAVVRLTHCYIIIIMRTILDGFAVGNAKGSIISVKKYFVIKKISFAFGKKFAIISNRRRYY